MVAERPSSSKGFWNARAARLRHETPNVWQQPYATETDAITLTLPALARCPAASPSNSERYRAALRIDVPILTAAIRNSGALNGGAWSRFWNSSTNVPVGESATQRDSLGKRLFGLD